MSVREFVLRDDRVRNHVLAEIGRLNLEKPWQVILKPYRKKRTNRQNSLYWEWLTIIGDEIGYDKDELHDILREKFLPVSQVTVFGIHRKVLTSTADEDFSTKDMAEYMDKIDRFAIQELGIRLPQPDDRFHEQCSP